MEHSEEILWKTQPKISGRSTDLSLHVPSECWSVWLYLPTKSDASFEGFTRWSFLIFKRTRQSTFMFMKRRKFRLALSHFPGMFEMDEKTRRWSTYFHVKPLTDELKLFLNGSKTLKFFFFFKWHFLIHICNNNENLIWNKHWENCTMYI